MVVVIICDALRDLVPLKNVKNNHEGVLFLVLKISLLHGCFSLFKNCANYTKSRKVSHVWKAKMVRNNNGAQIILKGNDETW